MLLLSLEILLLREKQVYKGATLSFELITSVFMNSQNISTWMSPSFLIAICNLLKSNSKGARSAKESLIYVWYKFLSPSFVHCRIIWQQVSVEPCSFRLWICSASIQEKFSLVVWRGWSDRERERDRDREAALLFLLTLCTKGVQHMRGYIDRKNVSAVQEYILPAPVAPMSAWPTCRVSFCAEVHFVCILSIAPKVFHNNYHSVGWWLWWGFPLKTLDTQDSFRSWLHSLNTQAYTFAYSYYFWLY